MSENLKCPYCGNNPVPHFLTWYFESSNVLYTPLRRIFLFNSIANLVKRVLKGMNLPWFFTRIFLSLGILSRQEDPAKCKVRRAAVLWEEAKGRGIKMTELLILGKPFDTYFAQKQNRNMVFSGLPRPYRFNFESLDVLDDKVILKKKFRQAGLPVPEGGSCWNLRQALTIFRKISKPVIVKPRAGSRGRHTTTFIQTEAELRQAFKIAKKLCFWVVVEEQLFGPVYRGTVIDFKTRGVLRGDSPEVTGDGAHNVRELINLKNSAPHPGVKDISMSKETEIFLARQNLNMASVPKPGEAVSLSEKIGVNYGGSSSEDYEICHPDNKELFERAANVGGDPIVGFDFIIPDIAKSHKNQKCGFLEANSLPFINLHHDPLLGQPRNIARYVWDLAGM